MSDAMACEATFCGIKLIGGRKVMQLICEVPIEYGDRVLAQLGGLPDPADPKWVFIVRRNAETPQET